MMPVRSGKTAVISGSGQGGDLCDCEKAHAAGHAKVVARCPTPKPDTVRSIPRASTSTVVKQIKEVERETHQGLRRARARRWPTPRAAQGIWTVPCDVALCPAPPQNELDRAGCRKGPGRPRRHRSVQRARSMPCHPRGRRRSFQEARRAVCTGQELPTRAA